MYCLFVFHLIFFLNINRRKVVFCLGSLIGSVRNHFFPILEFSYKVIRFLLKSSVVKSNNEIFLLQYGMSQADSALARHF